MSNVKGHWRKLKAGAKGVGPDGSVVIGKTWVDAHSRNVKTEKVERAPAAVFDKGVTRPQKDAILFKKYKEDPSKENLTVLMRQFEGMIRSSVNRYSGASSVPPQALRMRAFAQVKKAIDTYDPNAGAALATHVSNYLKRIDSVALEYANLGYVPPNRAAKEFGPYKDALEKLKEKLDRPPSSQELADELGWSVKQVSRLQRESRNDLIASKFDSPDTMPEYRVQQDKETEAAQLIYSDPSTSNDEKIVLEHLLGMNGKEIIKKGEIAKRYFKGSNPKVSRIVKKLDKKFTDLGV